jgi:hypothetical protein
MASPPCGGAVRTYAGKVEQSIRTEGHGTSEGGPRAFISYSHDNLEHKAWVLALAERLRGHGVDVVLDQWELVAGKELPQFMESGLSSSEWVIAICTTAYNSKANARDGGAGYESRIITADLFSHASRKDHVIPILRDANAAPPVPTFLTGLKWVDLREDGLYDDGYEELLRRLHQEPANPKPDLGPNPFAERDGELWVPLNHRPDRYFQPAGRGRVEFPYENNSGNLVLGAGDYRFTTHWSSCGPGSLYFYRDPSDIHSVALAPQPGTFENVGDAFHYDSSSRTRVASVGDAALFRNRNDYWLAVLVEDVTIRNRSDPQSLALLVGAYLILTDRSSRFSSGARSTRR